MENFLAVVEIIIVDVWQRVYEDIASSGSLRLPALHGSESLSARFDLAIKRHPNNAAPSRQLADRRKQNFNRM